MSLINQMLRDLQDPSSIGPAMAVALLTNLSGAIFAKLFAFPIAVQLRGRPVHEYT